MVNEPKSGYWKACPENNKFYFLSICTCKKNYFCTKHKELYENKINTKNKIKTFEIIICNLQWIINASTSNQYLTMVN